MENLISPDERQPLLVELTNEMESRLNEADNRVSSIAGSLNTICETEPPESTPFPPVHDFVSKMEYFIARISSLNDRLLRIDQKLKTLI